MVFPLHLNLNLPDLQKIRVKFYDRRACIISPWSDGVIAEI